MPKSGKPSIEEIRHSLAHVLAIAVLKKFPDAKLGIGPAIDDGFYYDFLLPRPLKEDELPELQKSMVKIIKEELPFKGKEISVSEAKEMFKGQQFKQELIEEFSKEGKTLTAYDTGGVFIDLCKGGHVTNTRQIPHDAFTLTKIAGAYWRGDEKNAQLQRIYGLAFETEKELEKYEKMLEEAKKRDHKRLGVKLDLFTFSPLVGAGLPLWTPRGTFIRNELDNFVWALRKEAGYMQVDIPHITKKELYETSGHWDKFKDELFKITTREGHLFAMKPMNCPHHTQIYARKQHSYREMPRRYANTTKVYRDEQTGELAGLSRVRAITQDDAHVFCRHTQVKEEIGKIWNIIEKFYKAVGFNLRIRLSLYDPEHPEKYLGTPDIWRRSEKELRTLIKERDVKSTEAIGEAAFYGPKIDFMASDSLGREWQVATIQLDMNMPDRFDLTCINEKGEKERIVMIHAAIMGSIERYLAILIEHFAGAFPLWLSPIQVVVIPVGEAHQGYAWGINEDLRLADIQSELDDSNETLAKRVRSAETQKIPYIVVVGEKEMHANTLSVRKRGKGNLGTQTLKNFLGTLKGEIASKML